MYATTIEMIVLRLELATFFASHQVKARKARKAQTLETANRDSSLSPERSDIAYSSQV
jgi:hypothetical protein